MGKSRRIDLVAEMADAQLGDPRRNERLARIVRAVSSAPEKSFPSLLDPSQLEGLYRFLANENFEASAVLEPHVQATLKRCEAAKAVVIAHDTTEFNFGKTKREGLGRLTHGESRGFFGHFALAMRGDETRQPLGVLGFEAMFRREERKKRRSHAMDAHDPDNERLRWRRMLKRMSDALPRGVEAVHVMDREADSYSLFAEMIRGEDRFVVRCSRDRNLGGDHEGEKISEALAHTDAVLEREVPLTARKKSVFPSYRRLHPPRAQRMAKLKVSAITPTIPRPITSRHSPEETLTLNLVHVYEVDAPEGEPPVEWQLWTNLPIATTEQIARVVDAYRSRWVIEEYFKALKTGCAYESRQIESLQGLLRALAIFIPVAWQLLLLRSTARDLPQGPVVALTAMQIECMRALCRKRKMIISAKPTAREAMLGVACLGGHLKRNGDPGWMVLARGLTTLLAAEVGYRAALDL